LDAVHVIRLFRHSFLETRSAYVIRYEVSTQVGPSEWASLNLCLD